MAPADLGQVMQQQQQPHVAHSKYVQHAGLQASPKCPQTSAQQQQQQRCTVVSTGTGPLGAAATAPVGDPGLPVAAFAPSGEP